MNEKTKEFKQVGKSCLKDFTRGLSAESIAYYYSFFAPRMIIDIVRGCNVTYEIFDSYKRYSHIRKFPKPEKVN